MTMTVALPAAPRWRSLVGAFLLGLTALLLPSCENGGHFTILGYTTRPNYDPNIRTVRLNIFKNLTMYRGLEFELAESLTREIELQTPFKVVGLGSSADTELSGTIVTYNKNVINRNQENEIREAETVLAALVVWRDLRTGEVISNPLPGARPAIPLVMPEMLVGSPPGAVAPLDGSMVPPSAPLPTPPGAPVVAAPGVVVPPPLPAPAPVVVQSTASFIPELGQSITSARKRNVDSLAVQIISMMELPWPTPTHEPCTPGVSAAAP